MTDQTIPRQSRDPRWLYAGRSCDRLASVVTPGADESNMPALWLRERTAIHERHKARDRRDEKDRHYGPWCFADEETAAGFANEFRAAT